MCYYNLTVYTPNTLSLLYLAPFGPWSTYQSTYLLYLSCSNLFHRWFNCRVCWGLYLLPGASPGLGRGFRSWSWRFGRESSLLRHIEAVSCCGWVVDWEEISRFLFHSLCYGFEYSKDNPKNINSHTSSKPSGFQVSGILRILYQRVCLKNRANVLESNQVESKVDSQRIS